MFVHDDELKQWVNNTLPRDFFERFESDATMAKFREVSTWAQSHRTYNNTAKRKFLDPTKADIYLVAYSAAHPENYTIVSFEKPNPHNVGEIKLPDACDAFGVRCIMMADMFRDLGQTY